MKELNQKCSYKELCKMTSAQKSDYSDLIKDLNRTNSNKNCSTKEKGDALEKLTFFLLNASGGLFTVRPNLRTATNEIDVIITLTPSGSYLVTQGVCSPLLQNFIGECKNYSKSVDVTFVGKFCSLLLTNQIQLGILFSYHGVSGKNWSHSAGLIKKFYLHKEEKEKRYCIIDFNLTEFERIEAGDNFLNIIDEKIASLQFDTDYTRYLSKHPAE